MAVRKWSVSIDEEFASRVEQHVSGRGLSGFVSRAVDHELERDALAEYRDGLDVEFGSVAAELVDKYDAQWPWSSTARRSRLSLARGQHSPA